MTDSHTILLGLLWLALIWLVGFAVFSATMKPAVRHWMRVIGLSYALGAAVLPLLLFYLSLAGFKPSRGILVGIAIVAMLSIYWLRRLHRLPGITLPAPRRKFDPLTLLGLIGGSLVIAAAFNIAAHFSWPGLNDIDAFATWMFKAKIVSLDPLRPVPAALTDPILSYSHQDYPLSLPLLVGGLYAAIGRIDDSAVKLLLLPTWMALTAIFYSSIRRFTRRASAIAVTAVFATAPTLTQNAALLVAETPLILALTAAATHLLAWMEDGEPGELILAGIMTASAAFTKNEGLAILPAIAAAAMIAAVIRRRIKEWTVAATITLIMIAPWLIYRRYLPRTHEDYGSKLLSPATLRHHLSERAPVISEYLYRLFDAPRVGLIWYLLVLTALFAPRALARTSVRMLWCILLIQLGLYVAAFIVTPWDLGRLIPMVTPKLQTQASPIAALLIALNLREISRTAASPIQLKRGLGRF